MMDSLRVQPVVAIAQHRLECDDCQALAIYILVIQEQDGQLYYRKYCQSCYERMWQRQQLEGRQE